MRFKLVTGILLFAALVVALVAIQAGNTSSTHSSTHPAARPPLTAGLTVASCGGAGQPHYMGQCLPHPVSLTPGKPSLLFGLTISGGDTSNNDPILGLANWHVIARESSFAIFKVSEGDSFTDRYAAPQTSAARASGLVVGGYDFAHVCDNPASEAHLFAADYRADGLLSKRAFHPWLDIEYKQQGASCNARDWLLNLISDVHAATGEEPGIYTGAWFWNPTFGAWWPNPAIRSWVSGYGVRYPFMPGSRKELDMWQYTDARPVLGGSIDWSVWEAGSAAFAAYVQGAKPPPSKAQLAVWRDGRNASLRQFAKRRCGAHLARPDCWTFGVRRVMYFQSRIEESSPRVHCFGAHAQLKAPKCQVVRPYVSRWSRLRDQAKTTHRVKHERRYAALVKSHLY